MSDDALETLSSKLEGLIAALEPGARRALSREIGTMLRAANAARISQQRNPDGSAFAPRLPQKPKKKGLRARKGRVRRMFGKLKQTRWLKITATADVSEVGFVGSAARIARVHHLGLVDRVSAKGPRVKYQSRQLMAIIADDRDQVETIILTHLAR